MEEKLRRNLQLSLSSIRSWDLMQLYILCYLLLWSGQNVAVVIHRTFSSSLDLTANFSPGLKLDSLVTTALSCNTAYGQYMASAWAAHGQRDASLVATALSCNTGHYSA